MQCILKIQVLCSNIFSPNLVLAWDGFSNAQLFIGNNIAYYRPLIFPGPLAFMSHDHVAL